MLISLVMQATWHAHLFSYAGNVACSGAFDWCVGERVNLSSSLSLK